MTLVVIPFERIMLSARHFFFVKIFFTLDSSAKQMTSRLLLSNCRARFSAKKVALFRTRQKTGEKRKVTATEINWKRGKIRLNSFDFCAEFFYFYALIFVGGLSWELGLLSRSVCVKKNQNKHDAFLNQS